MYVLNIRYHPLLQQIYMMGFEVESGVTATCVNKLWKQEIR